ncbi:MAG TPA: N-acetylmuramoyl-L-alanine amidase [Acidimicrobiia bacterium]|nr:N-acetylmuramoyl-L-alanine amidase [Acidimicrobiia bacterium]
MRSTRLIAVVLVVLVLFGGVLAWRLLDEPLPEAGPDGTSLPAGQGRVGYVVTRQGTTLSPQPGVAGTRVAANLIFPVSGEQSGALEVLDNCNRTGWVAANDVESGIVPIAKGEDMGGSVFVIDPGHGAPDLGAVGPGGLTEAEANIDVSSRVIELLSESRDIDWVSGSVTPGTTYHAAAVAVSTRSTDGPNRGDYELGLTFRAELGNAVDATALVSIHHNTQPTHDTEGPGTSAYVSVANEESPRLGGLLVDEVRRSLAGFEADWVGGQRSLVARVDANGEDYYSILALSEVPAAIIEGAYISNPSEEELIATGAFRQAYAEGVYRALVRFVLTDDYPIAEPEPELYDPDSPPRSMDDCVTPR